jgi:hypothetical protein
MSDADDKLWEHMNREDALKANSVANSSLEQQSMRGVMSAQIPAGFYFKNVEDPH